MANLDQELLKIGCPGCGGTLRVAAQLVGRRARCKACGATWVIEPAGKSAAAEQARLPELVGVNCHVCDTRLYGRVDQVGREVACPDCGARTKLPPPMQQSVRSVMVEFGDEYLVDTSVPPLAAPRMLSEAAEERIHREVEMASLGAIDEQDAQQKARRRRQTDARGRPLIPRWPLLTGVVSFLASPGVPTRWLTISAAALLIGTLLLASLTALGALQPAMTGISPDAMGAISAICFLMIACVLGVLLLSVMAAMALAIVVESSEGCDRVHTWPMPLYIVEWFADAVYLPIAMMVSAAPGWLVGGQIAQSPDEHAVCVGLSMLALFPLVLLSQLEASSVAAVLTGDVLASLGRCPGSWIVFYLESALLAAASGALAIALWRLHAALPLMLVPLLVGIMLVYFRLLGRLGWVIGEATPGR